MRAWKQWAAEAIGQEDMSAAECSVLILTALAFVACVHLALQSLSAVELWEPEPTEYQMELITLHNKEQWTNGMGTEVEP